MVEVIALLRLEMGEEPARDVCDKAIKTTFLRASRFENGSGTFVRNITLVEVSLLRLEMGEELLRDVCNKTINHLFYGSNKLHIAFRSLCQ